MTLQTRLERVEGDRWQLIEGEQVLGSPRYSELRISLSWKANVFADPDEARVYDERSDQLTIESVWETFCDDLSARGVAFARPQDPLRDLHWTELLGRTYKQEPNLAA